jgi:folate-dependent phosphoribosylglycinamide formyltransferase PurN
LPGGDEVLAVAEQQAILDRPIRVLLFGGGPVLEEDVKEFLIRLEAEPDIEFLGAFCQSTGQTVKHIILDLWQRRRWLAIPLLALRIGASCIHFLLHSRRRHRQNRQLARLATRIHLVPNLHAQTVVDQIRTLAPDLGLVYGSPILKPALFELPALGTLGIHHGKVPQYRGKKTTFWAMYNGETEAGVTIQKINRGLDTGHIVNSGAVSTVRRSYGAVWSQLVSLGLDLYIQSILQVKNGTATYRPQEGPKGKLYRDPKMSDIWRFWRQQLVHRLLWTVVREHES